MDPRGRIPEGGHVVAHPGDGERLIIGEAATYLSVATIATECAEMEWPCRLLRVVPDGQEVQRDPVIAHQRCSTRWRVVEEVDAHLAFGPQGMEVAGIIDRVRRLTPKEVQALDAAAREAAREAAWAAALGTLVRDLIPTSDYDTLMAPWWKVVGDA